MTQPQYDSEPVISAALDDLDHYSTQFLIEKIKNRSSTSPLTGNEVEILTHIGALAQAGEELHPTLAGLLTLGMNPQRFYPQLSATIVVLPTKKFGDRGPDGKRFLASRRLNGTIQHITEAAPRELDQFLPASEHHKNYEGKRRTMLLDVARSLIFNALTERDYAPHSLGGSLQVELYPDRLVLHYPGKFSYKAEKPNPTIEALMAAMDLTNYKRNLGELIHQLRTVGIPAPTIEQERQRVRITLIR
ncbi:hypothetical protein [Corynebacterium sp.]|uniref:hypothetical protein n=1 Tax=Corynebacterium sp. TaxID=1720 RepID=UPI0026DAB670|nr:hypothetical protein [Corynebacterium sp.]MDO5077606.1 hypothetical protein [Corynebacterium sp.]